MDYAPTVRELVVTMRGSARHAMTCLGTDQVWIWGNFCSPFDLPCKVLSVDCHTVQTRAFWLIIPWSTLSFVSFFQVELHFLVLLPHPAFFCCSSSMDRAAARYRHLLFTAMILSLTFSILFLPHPIQEWMTKGWLCTNSSCYFVSKWTPMGTISCIHCELIASYCWTSQE